MMGKPPLRKLILVQILHCTLEYHSVKKNKYIVLSSKSQDGHQGAVIQDKLQYPRGFPV